MSWSFAVGAALALSRRRITSANSGAERYLVRR
jgi:hypothetical protein